MKNAREARIFVYRMTATSLRKRAITLKPAEVSDNPVTDAQMQRIRKEAIKLAEHLEGKMAKLRGDVPPEDLV